MKIPSGDVIQADSLERVITVIEAVANGDRTTPQLAAAIGNLTLRQGSYYRRAAEAMGFLIRSSENHSILSDLGKIYIKASEPERGFILLRAFLSTPFVVRLLSFLENYQHGVSRSQIELFLGAVADLGSESTIGRRVSSYIKWLVEFEIIRVANEKYLLNKLPAGVNYLNISSDEEPLLPNRFELKDYEKQTERVRTHSGDILYFVDQAKHERGLDSHQYLINLVAEKIRNFGAIPKSNKYIDLTAKIGGHNFIFEMKSTTGENIHSQVRRGLSQLYEYRYIQNVDEPCLVLALENRIPKAHRWLEDYLINDRQILLIWDGNGKLSTQESLVDKLSFIA